MATTIEKYLNKCQEVVDAKPKYKNGASSLTECDCIGMDKYAFRECGVSFSTSGTNYSARNQVDGLKAIAGTGDLHIGDVVFKGRNEGEAGYDLPEKYRPGGKSFNGDLTDYYHIGTVKSVYPLQIIHMTSPTAKTDTKIGKWGYVASWKAQFIKDGAPAPEPVPEPAPDPGPEPTPEPEPMIPAVVRSENGNPVNLRSGPTIYAQLVDRVPVGECVDVCGTEGEWSFIVWGRKSGYMMTRFLNFADDAKPTLKRGSRGGYVEELQAMLLMLRYNIGTTYADGIFGKGVESAVIQFEKDHGLKADGVVRRDVWDALDALCSPAIEQEQASGQPEEGEKPLFTVTIEHLTAQQADALKARFLNADISAERG